jgi:hypothetical protein
MVYDRTDSYTRELLQSSPGLYLCVSQGVALGWNLRTPSAFTQNHIRGFVNYISAFGRRFGEGLESDRANLLILATFLSLDVQR